MSTLDRLACAQGRRDEAPNQELARDLAAQGDREGIRELAANLGHADPNVRSDCLKTLYEVGYLKPELIADYAGGFLGLLRDRNNRMVWGGMIALSTIAPLRAGELYPHRQQIQEAMAEGSVTPHLRPPQVGAGVTVDNGVKVLAEVAAADETYRAELLPYLFHHLQTCRPKDVPPHAEAIVPAVNAAHTEAFVAVVERRLGNMSASQATRVKRAIAQARQSARETGG